MADAENDVVKEEEEVEEETPRKRKGRAAAAAAVAKLAKLDASDDEDDMEDEDVNLGDDDEDEDPDEDMGGVDDDDDDEGDGDEEKEDGDDEEPIGKIKSIFICEECDMKFEKAEDCVLHRKTHEPKKEPTEGDEELDPVAAERRRKLAKFTDEQILAKLVERQAAFVCVCGIIFKDQTLYYLHRGSHSATNPHQCSFCKYVAKDWYEFTTHFFVHKKTKPKEEGKEGEGDAPAAAGAPPTEEGGAQDSEPIQIKQEPLDD